MIDPRVLKGFKDSLPEEEIIKKLFINKIENALEKNGFVPIDTPALEYFDILTGKGGEETDKQIFNFVDSGGRKVGLRFDLTVPLARFVSLHENELVFPFKRFHISKVWRGEKPQKGRFREFIQADFDIIGVKGLTSDIEIVENIILLLSSIGIKGFVIHLNDRSLLKEIFQKIEVDNIELKILKIFDKYYKTSRDWVKENLIKVFKENGKDSKKVELLIDLLIDSENHIKFFENLEKHFEITNSSLEKIYKHFENRGLSSNIKIDGTITRGLDYYTGLVFETFIEDHKEYGAICSGGRYDNLTSVFSKNVYPGIGGSIGIDRLVAYLIDNNLIEKRTTLTKVLIINFSEENLAIYYDIADILKSNNINTEIYSDTAKLKKQFKYADKKGIPFCLIMGEDEINKKIFKIKDLKNSKEIVFNNLEKMVEFLK